MYFFVESLVKYRKFKKEKKKNQTGLTPKKSWLIFLGVYNF